MEKEMMQVGVSAAQVSKELSPNSLIKIELLFGERVQVLEREGDRVKIQTDTLDAYEGYLDATDLVAAFEPTHRVCARFAPGHHTPYFKNPIAGEPLYFNSLVTVVETVETDEGRMNKVKGFGWVYEIHLCDISYRAPDFLEECLKFLEAPYGYERRSTSIDCSTLVQAGCIAAGIACPYDVKSGEMEKLGEAVDFKPDFSNLQRGDLVFWTLDKGSHVAIMLDDVNCFHATTAEPHHKAFIQPLKETIFEQARDGNGPVTKVRRF